LPEALVSIDTGQTLYVTAASKQGSKIKTLAKKSVFISPKIGSRIEG
jgi:hypothetical protein